MDKVRSDSDIIQICYASWVASYNACMKVAEVNDGGKWMLCEFSISVPECVHRGSGQNG
jgi:hypothetical protein